MEYISSKEASKILNKSERRLQQLCKDNKIEGAIKKGKSWFIPSNFLNEDLKNNVFIQKKKPLPIGIADFKKASSEYYYVDKTLLIKDFLDKKPQVSLFTRPRRFGKTLMMDMLRVFFEKTSEDNSIYFKDKNIWKYGEEYTSYQGKYPVIFITFKDLKCSTYDDFFEKIKNLISIEYSRHPELETSPNLNEFEVSQYKKIVNKKASLVDYEMSLEFLSLYLYKHHKKEVIIIIDEYDSPIEQGYTSGFYNKIIDFMRVFFSGGLKDNSSLAFGFLTGILRVAKESIFSGLNNLKINSILDDEYSEYFGFTKNEVIDLLNYYGYNNKYYEINEWYDGYLFGNKEIFNPWSVINYVSSNCAPKAYWISTGSNDIIGQIIEHASIETIENLQKLLTGNKVLTYIDTNVIYPEIEKNPNSIYSFLLVAGYLKISKKYPQFDGNYMCEVQIPNKEISYVYGKEILIKTKRENIAIEIQQAIFSNNIESLKTLLEKYMTESISSFDAANETFYHGMMLGLCAIFTNKYKVSSNKESGYGRFDIELIPINKINPGFIFEFKKGNNENNLKELANVALKQIDEMKYDTNMKKDGIREIIKIGIAFYKKKAIIVSK